MKDEEKRATRYLHEMDELRKLLIENPGIPLVIYAGEDANIGNYPYTLCTSASAYKGEFLDCMQDVNNERAYDDRELFAEDLYDKLYDSYEGTDEEFEVYFKDQLKEYEPFWKDAIILYVNN